MTWLLFYQNNRSRSLLPSLSLGVDMNIDVTQLMETNMAEGR